MEAKILNSLTIIFFINAVLKELQFLELKHIKISKQNLTQQDEDIKTLMLNEQRNQRLVDSKGYLVNNCDAVHKKAMKSLNF